MARRRSLISRIINPKPKAFALFRGMTSLVPPLRDILGFYPEIAPIPDRAEHVFEETDYRIRLASPEFADTLKLFETGNWDICRPLILKKDPFICQRYTAIIRDVSVPGHTLTPVDPETGKQIIFGQQGFSNWNFSKPGFVTCHNRIISELSYIIPPYWNYWHIMLEVLLPLVHAVSLGALQGKPLRILTSGRRPPVIDSVLAGLQLQGVELIIDEVSPRERLSVKRMLFADNQCWNVERNYALSSAIPLMRDIFERTYSASGQNHGTNNGNGKRILLTRSGSKLRNLLNQNDIFEALRKYGFEVFQANWNNHPEQLKVFSEAGMIIAPHGAGLTNIIFSQPGTKIIELFANDYRKTSAFHLSAEQGLDYHPVFGSDEVENSHFSVDPDKVVKTVEKLI